MKDTIGIPKMLTDLIEELKVRRCDLIGVYFLFHRLIKYNHSIITWGRKVISN